MNCFKSFGPDGIYPKLLESLANDFKFVDAVVMLFRACTDTVDISTLTLSFWPYTHNILIYKLKYLGIYGNLLDIIKDFVTGRSLRGQGRALHQEFLEIDFLVVSDRSDYLVIKVSSISY